MMGRAGLVLIDSNVLIDLMKAGSEWHEWSLEAVEREGERSILGLNQIAYAELSPGFDRPADLDSAFPEATFRRLSLPWRAAFVAAHVHAEYRRRGGARRAVLPDFYIGAHALVDGMTLLTRDAARYRTYFPTLEIIAP